MKRLILLLAVVGCSHDALEIRTQDQNGVKVGLLFENDGCKVWRFEDAGHYRYYADCGSVSTSHDETRVQSNGKTTTTYQVTVPDEIPNARPKR